MSNFLTRVRYLPYMPVGRITGRGLPRCIVDTATRVKHITTNTMSNSMGADTNHHSTVDDVGSMAQLVTLTTISLRTHLRAGPTVTDTISAIANLNTSFNLL